MGVYWNKIVSVKLILLSSILLGIVAIVTIPRRMLVYEI